VQGGRENSGKPDGGKKGCHLIPEKRLLDSWLEKPPDLPQTGSPKAKPMEEEGEGTGAFRKRKTCHAQWCSGKEKRMGSV